MATGDKARKIIVDDLSAGLYEVQLGRKNHRITRVMKALMLRHDFVNFLKELEDKGLKEKMQKIRGGKKVKIWTIDFETSDKLINKYLVRNRKSVFYKKLSSSWQKHYETISYMLLLYTYLDGFATSRNDNIIPAFKKVFFDDATNYPNIFQQIYDKELFWKFYEDAFHTNAKENIKKYEGHPIETSEGDRPYDELPIAIQAKTDPARPKVCMLIFDETTSIEELKDFLDKKKISIFDSLKSLRPSREEKRLTSSKTLLRDIALYNKYEEFKKEGFKNPDFKVQSWIRDNPDRHQWLVDAITIRKIVSELRKDIRAVNSEK